MIIKLVPWLLCLIVYVCGEESSGEEPFLVTTTFLDEDMLLTMPISLEPSSSNAANTTEAERTAGTITSEISEVSSGVHPFMRSKENLTETYFPWKGADATSVPYTNVSSAGNETMPCKGNLCPFIENETTFFKQPWMNILPLLVVICLPLLILTICIICLCHKQRKMKKSPTNFSYLWKTEEGSEYSEALSTPDSSSELCVRSAKSVSHINMNLNNNAVRSGRMYPSLIGSNTADAVRRGDLEEVHQLMFMNVSFKNEKDLNGWGVLHIAIYNHDVQMLKMLLEGVELGLVDLFERNNDGQAPIVFAASLCNNQLDCIALLIDTLSDVRNRGISHENQTEDKKQLPLSGENINEWALVDDLGRNVIHYASLNNSAQAIYFFYASGADINYIDFRGDSPLHLATREGNMPAVQALLDCGVNTCVKNADGIEPITLAENRNFCIVADKIRRASSGKKQRRRATTFCTTDSARGTSDSWVSRHNSFRSENELKQSSTSFPSDLDLESGRSFTYIPGYEIGLPSKAWNEGDGFCYNYDTRKRTFLPPLGSDTFDEFFSRSTTLPASNSEKPNLLADPCETDSCTDSSSIPYVKNSPTFTELDQEHVNLDGKYPYFSQGLYSFKP